MAARDFDVIVCGAGVGGLTAAIRFARQGRSVLLIDKQDGAAETFKGELLHPASMATLDEMDVLESLRDHGARVVDRLISSTADGTELCSMNLRWFDGPYDHCLTSSYKDICDVLTRSLPNGVTFLRRTIVEDLMRDADGRALGVRVKSGGAVDSVRAPLVVAADGRSSRLRTQVGITVAQQEYGHQVVGLELTDEPSLHTWANTVITPEGMRVMYPMPHRGGRLYLQIPKGFANRVGKAEIGEWTLRTVSTTPALRQLQDSVGRAVPDARVLSARRFVADRFDRAGVALIGDAAHVLHPMAGQGMNAAIADAKVLSAALAEVDVDDRGAVDAALAAYTATRHPETVTICEFSHRFADLFTSTTTALGYLKTRYILGCHGRNQRLSYKIMHNIAGLGYQRFTVLDRLQQLGFPDRNAGLPGRPGMRDRVCSAP
ncbi:FAD-dependent oxidoreductase [Nocardia transvalensis]|uniref:FAD-dependent oxidoreductase n=1 Tax=Nocardia transvalensis TaxID=37333 RepID=UPI001894F62B|nr:NAD(P)/FAD-dependent oxidoreductase [Nocardia transvalensis]MBF6329427.1 FAD-dependent monooxygenase [Nocardia transvalensis]